MQLLFYKLLPRVGQPMLREYETRETPCFFSASDFPIPSSITASRDTFILIVLELLTIQINNLVRREPRSLEFSQFHDFLNI